MLQLMFFIGLLSVQSTTQSPEEREARCHDDVELKCPHPDINKFDSVVWYKSHDQKRHNIVRKTVKTGKESRYELNSRGTFGEDYSLLLPRVTPNDSTVYVCSLSAKIGHHDVDVEVNLVVHECVTVSTPLTPDLNSTSLQPAYKEVPLLWSLGTYAAVVILKITVSITCVLVIRHHCSRKRRHRR